MEIKISIQRDAKNQPFAVVLYDGQTPFNLDEDTKNGANYLARKSTPEDDEGLVYVSTETGEPLESSQIDNKFENDCYCISGSESGKNCVRRLISTILTGANNFDCQYPVYVTDGNEVVYMNKENLDGNYTYEPDEKWQIISSMLKPQEQNHRSQVR